MSTRTSQDIKAELDRLAKKLEGPHGAQYSERWSQLNMEYQLARATGR